MTPSSSTTQLCRRLLSQWRQNLNLNNLERYQLAGELKALDRQLERLMQNRFRVAVFGKVGVGKSSLLNALIGKKEFATDVAHGCTRQAQYVNWNQSINNLQAIELIDTPGIDEIAAQGRTRLASKMALQTDLILLVLDSDINYIEIEALQTFLRTGKPILIVLNRTDQWTSQQCTDLIASICNRFPSEAKGLELIAVAAAPRQAQIQSNGKVRSTISSPIIEPLRDRLVSLLSSQGQLFLALNAIRQADNFHHSLRTGRLKRSKKAAQSLIGRFATLKASGVAVNPLLMIDLAGGLAFDTALIVQLSQLYGLPMGGSSARRLLKRLSIYNAYLGGAQLGIQFVLSILRQILIISTPLTSGLSLASSAPVALAQAALAVHTTKITGKLAAKELLRGTTKRDPQPRTILRHLAASDPQIRQWLDNFPQALTKDYSELHKLLP